MTTQSVELPARYFVLPTLLSLLAVLLVAVGWCSFKAVHAKRWCVAALQEGWTMAGGTVVSRPREGS